MSHLRIKGWMLLVSSGYLVPSDLWAQLNENCTVSILNRNVQVQPDGTWVLPNLPANVGRVRARAVCIQNGLTQLGQSDLFTITTNSSLNVNPPVKLGVVTPVPQSLGLTASTTVLNSVGATVQLTVTATYPDGTTANVTPASAGTDYTTSNSGVVTVTPDGLVTGVATGTAIITTFNEGTSGTTSIRVGIPPTITITSPIPGATVTEGATITVTATTTGTVAFVTFLASSQVASTTNGAPYQFAYTVPLGATTVTFGARADNGFGDIGTAQSVQINVAHDPLTTVTGRVLDSSAQAVPGAVVTAFNQFTATTIADGTFSISGVPTARGNITVIATATIGGVPLNGISSSVAPVPGGTTIVGDLLLSSASLWIPLAPTGGPPTGRYLSTGVYDAATKQMIIFGGVDKLGDRNDLWVLSLGSSPQWTLLSPTGALPRPRVGHTTVYDDAHAHMMVFGGGLGQTSPCVNEVWVLSNANSVGGAPAWSQLNPSGAAPAVRVVHSAVYDAASNRMTIFGGANCFSTFFNDVWVLTNANGLSGAPAWTQLAPSGTPPSPTGYHSAVYDPGSNRMIVFGGVSAGTVSNRVWVLTNANGLGGTSAWIQFAPTGPSIPPRANHGAVYDVALNRMIVFGGGSSSDFQDTWVLSNANGVGGTPSWTQLSPSGALPPAREGFPAVYDPAIDRMTFFGGRNDSLSPNLLNDTWVLTNANGAK